MDSRKRGPSREKYILQGPHEDAQCCHRQSIYLDNWSVHDGVRKLDDSFLEEKDFRDTLDQVQGHRLSTADMLSVGGKTYIRVEHGLGEDKIGNCDCTVGSVHKCNIGYLQDLIENLERVDLSESSSPVLARQAYDIDCPLTSSP